MKWMNNPMVMKANLIIVPLYLSYMGHKYYRDRKDNLENPITQRALTVLKADKRVVDFCGENIAPGYKVKKTENDGIVTYTFKVSGSSGKLNTVVTADYASHSSLKIFSDELEEHHKKKEAQLPDYDAKDFEDNWPIDLEEYDLPDSKLFKEIQDEDKRQEISKQKISSDEKIWRIKSLRVSVDDDTRILLLPLPESKRSKKLVETEYNLDSYQDIIRRFERKQEKYEHLLDEEYKRFEDKTEEEVLEDIKHRRRKQFQSMNRMRKYQFMFFAGALMFYLIIWKRIAPKPVLNSLVYHQAIELIKNPHVTEKVGDFFQVINCKGKIYPLISKVSFEIVVDGNKDQAKFKFNSEYKQKIGIWLIEEMYMLTKSDLKTTKLI
uniref:Uncharacterized protein n=1 Tax=Euplotes harpa TaxID=151035 RepID=A0A7S3JE05_9SPIT|mmetsp:Transcript_34770/g.40253  ORF Transcript_34770/g.40253 Transcript_34770/m.40253 type:complete len:380 (+) Transcript_34770:22-1161(+)